jgi:hypothetical protein
MNGETGTIAVRKFRLKVARGENLLLDREGVLTDRLTKITNISNSCVVFLN